MDKKPSKHLGDIFSPTFSKLESDTLAQVSDGNIREEDHITSTLFTLATERINVLGEQLSSRGDANALTIT